VHLVTRPPDFDHIVRVTLDRPFERVASPRDDTGDPQSAQPPKEKELDAMGEVSAVPRGSDGGEKTVEVTFVEKVFFNDDPNDFDV
jgi:hypothetical protein